MRLQPDETQNRKKYAFTSQSAEQTAALGRIIGKRLRQGLTLLLFGDLGSGKTAFSQGLARGLEIPASYAITSPTYTLINEYPGKLPFYHVDLYRLPDSVNPEEIGLEEIFEEEGVVCVEWADRLHAADRPPRRLDLSFRVTGDNRRDIRVIEYGLDSSILLHDIDIQT